MIKGRRRSGETLGPPGGRSSRLDDTHIDRGHDGEGELAQSRPALDMRSLWSTSLGDGDLHCANLTVTQRPVGRVDW